MSSMSGSKKVRLPHLAPNRNDTLSTTHDAGSDPGRAKESGEEYCFKKKLLDTRSPIQRTRVKEHATTAPKLQQAMPWPVCVAGAQSHSIHQEQGSRGCQKPKSTPSSSEWNIRAASRPCLQAKVSMFSCWQTLYCLYMEAWIRFETSHRNGLSHNQGSCLPSSSCLQQTLPFSLHEDGWLV